MGGWGVVKGFDSGCQRGTIYRSLGWAGRTRVSEGGRQEIGTARQRMFHPRLQYAEITHLQHYSSELVHIPHL